MTDIVERLRSADLWECQEGVPTDVGMFKSEIGKEAADEIERLRGVLNRINETIYAAGAPIGTDRYFAIRELASEPGRPE